MASTTFTPGTVVASPWLNDVNDHVYDGHVYVYATGVAATDAANLSAAFTQAVAQNKMVVGIGTFALTTLLSITGPCDFRGATLTTDPSLPIAVEIKSSVNLSSPTRPDYLQRKYMFLPQIEASTFPYTGVAGDLASWSARGEGVRIVNCISCEIHIPYVYGFSVGVRVAALGNGVSTACSWNDIHYGEISNNLVNLFVDALDSLGFCNENNHYVGRFAHKSPLTATAIPGCVHHKIGATGGGSNSQKFFSPSIEGEQVEYHIDTSEGYSVWYAARGEAYSLTVPRIRFNGTAARNNSIFMNVTFGKPLVTNVGAAQLNQVDWVQGKVEDGSITTAVQVMRNTAAAAVFGVVRSSTDPHNATSSDLTMRIDEDKFAAKSPGDTVDRVTMNYNGTIEMGSGSAATDVRLSRPAAGLMGTSVGKLGSTNGLWVGNSTASGTAGTIVRRTEVFDASGASLGYIHIHDT
jgi:hypothetical protein